MKGLAFGGALAQIRAYKNQDLDCVARCLILGRDADLGEISNRLEQLCHVSTWASTRYWSDGILWRWETGPETETLISRHDFDSLGQLSSFAAMVAQGMRIEEGGLVRVVLGTLGSEKTYLLVLVHHLLTDAVIVKEIIRFALGNKGVVAGSRKFVVAPSLGDYERELFKVYSSPDRDETLRTRFTSLPLHGGLIHVTDRSRLGVDPFADFGELQREIQMDPRILAKLSSEKFGLWLHDACTGIALFALEKILGERGVYLYSSCVAGREDSIGVPRYLHTLGFLAYPASRTVSFDGARGISEFLEAYARNLAGMKSSDLVSASVEFTQWMSHETPLSSWLRDNLRPEIVFNYYGQLNAFDESQVVDVVDLPGMMAKENPRRCNIQFSFFLQNSGIKLAVAYNNNAVSKSLIEQWTAHIGNSFQEILTMR